MTRFRRRVMRSPASILITGASSGIGEGLAKHYAGSGRRLRLVGRNRDRLETVSQNCQALGAQVDIATQDVTDRKALAETLLQWDDTQPFDLAIANAGISGGAAGDTESDDNARRIFSINLDGVLNTIHPLLPRMRQRRNGQIALMSSMAAFRGFPSAPAYSASKAAVKAYGEALRPLLRPEGVRISVVYPGFVESRITAMNQFWMPMLMDADKAASIISRGLRRDQARIAFPILLYLAVWLVSVLPPVLGDPIVAKGPRKAE